MIIWYEECSSSGDHYEHAMTPNEYLSVGPHTDADQIAPPRTDEESGPQNSLKNVH